MTTTISTTDAKRTRWQNLWHTLHTLRFDPLPSEEEIDQVFSSLPKRQPKENLPDWLERVGRGGAGRTLTVLAEFQRWAASSATETQLPLPTVPMVSLNEAFRLTTTLLGGLISLHVEALGVAAFSYAGQTVGLTLQDGSDTLVEFELDENGNGEETVEDNEQARLALVQPCLGLVESGDGG